jgi:glycosyltransferase involved in cell wall biosynthesis|tara:strand:- start:124 stop:1071 length:948 start_codon:yes stop_codon:yes gene_type:complete
LKLGSKKISIVTNCFNEEANVGEVYRRVKEVVENITTVTSYEHIFIDNASTDGTVAVLKELASHDPALKVIVNNRNFGQIRSANHALLQATGDAVIHVVADLQDPPELIPEFLEKWAEGYAVVIGQKEGSRDGWLMRQLRKIFYSCMAAISDAPQIKNFTGFGLFDKKVIDTIRSLEDPYPYFRGLISEFGYSVAIVPYQQPARRRGKTTHNFYSLYDMAILGVTNHSKIPLRVATFAGIVLSVLSALVGMFYLVYKLLAWDDFDLGLAPLIIGMFFFAAVQLFFIGIVGEYIGSIHTQVLKRPMVVEKERINFE